MEMKTKIKGSVIGIAVLLVLIAAVSAVDATAVKVVPASQTVHAGENFCVDITIEDVTNMKADQARLYFEPNVLNATGIIEGNFLKTGGSTLPIEKIDNTEGFAGFAYALLSGTPVTGSGVLATIEFNTGGETEGTFNLSLTDVKIKNGTGGEIPVDVYNGTISIDNTPPTVEIISPANGDWFGSEAVNLTFHPRDNLADVLNYSIFLNEEEVANGTATNCSEEIVNLGMLSEGSYVLSVNVTDHAGLAGSAQITIHVDRTPPTVEIISPANGEWFDSEDVVVTFLPCDNQADVLNFSIFDNGSEVAKGTATNGSTKEVNLGVLSESEHLIKVEVADKAGTNFSEVTIHVDRTPPIITIKSPKEGKNYPGICIRLNFTADDLRSGVNETAYNLDGTGNITITGNTTICCLTPYDHCITVYTKDNVDKVNYSEVHFAVHPGDISDDLYVDIDDLEDLADAFFSNPGAGNWNENADLNCDDEVDLDDLEILVDHFFKSY